MRIRFSKNSILCIRVNQRIDLKIYFDSIINLPSTQRKIKESFLYQDQLLEYSFQSEII